MKRRESIPGLGKITMKNQNLFVRQTITVLMACGLIASLLPDFAAAQDLSTLEDICRSGIDIVSVGAITHSAPALDFSLELED